MLEHVATTYYNTHIANFQVLSKRDFSDFEDISDVKTQSQTKKVCH